MKRAIIFILFYAILNCSSAFGQSENISVTKFLQSLPNRVNYIEKSDIFKRDFQHTNSRFESFGKFYQIALPIKLSDSNSYGVMKKIDDVYYWIPDLKGDANNSSFELPDGRRFEFRHNQKHLAASEADHQSLTNRMNIFSDDYFEYRRITREIDRRSKSDEILLLLTGITLGGVSVIAVKADQRLFNDSSNTTLGVFTSTLSVTSLISFIRYKVKYNNLNERRGELLRKYHY